MRKLLSALVLGLCAAAIVNSSAVSAAPNDAAVKATAAASNADPGYSRVDGRWWYRTADGQRYVYSCNQWIRVPNEPGVASAPQPAAPQVAAPQRYTARRFSIEPTVIISYPNDGPADVSHGIEWYRNGRGSFSD
jgi:hypothetical protein